MQAKALLLIGLKVTDSINACDFQNIPYNSSRCLEILQLTTGCLFGPDGHLKIPHLWPGQNPPATER